MILYYLIGDKGSSKIEMYNSNWGVWVFSLKTVVEIKKNLVLLIPFILFYFIFRWFVGFIDTFVSK